MTLGQLRDGAGVPSLIEMTRRDDNEQWLRERAIFWLGNADDDRGRATLRTLAASDTLARDLRGQAIFGARLPGRRRRQRAVPARAVPPARRLAAQGQGHPGRRTARRGRRPALARGSRARRERVRGASQAGAVLARAARSRAVRRPARGVPAARLARTQASTTCSSSRSASESAAVDKLIDLARSDTDREIRAKATFWLGQSRDPRAAKYLEERISK